MPMVADLVFLFLGGSGCGGGSSVFKPYTHLVKVSALHFRNLREVNSRRVTVMKTRWLEEVNVTRVLFKPLSKLKPYSRQIIREKGMLQALQTRDIFYTLLTGQLFYWFGFKEYSHLFSNFTSHKALLSILLSVPLQEIHKWAELVLNCLVLEK